MDSKPNAIGEAPRYAPIQEWCRLAGIGRTTTYERIATGEVRAVKVGKRLLIDVNSGLAWLDSLPGAVVAISARERRRRTVARAA